jgi:hypothetical protein
MRVRLLTVVSTAAIVLASCGTTAHLSAASNGPVGSRGLGASGGVGNAGTASGSNSAGLSGGATGSGGGGNGVAGAGGGSGAAGGGGGAGAAPASGSGGGSIPSSSGSTAIKVPGVTGTSIYVGLSYATESSSTAANQALGAGGVTQGNTQGEMQAVINDMNSHGGILGRKIVPVWYAENALSTESSTQLYDGECQAFEQDNHVFAIFDGGNAITEQCAESAGAVAVYDNLSISSAPTFAKFPAYFEVGGMMDQSRVVLNEAHGLANQNYFSPWNANLSQAGGTKAKVGVLTYDSPDFHYAVDDVLVPQLRHLGYAPASQDVVYVTFPQSNADLGNDSANVSNAVLRFRADGVDHVLIIDGTGILTLEFLNNAYGQHYYPRYGFDSQNGPEVLAGAGDVPTAQLNGAMGIGWIPMLDLPSSANPDNGPYSNDARRACLAIMRSNGFTYSDTNSESAAIGICTSFEFLKDAILAGGTTINQANFITGANKLGYWNDTGDTFGNFYGPAQHDGAAYYRYYDWNNSCGCMEYTSGNKVAVGEGES